MNKHKLTAMILSIFMVISLAGCKSSDAKNMVAAIDSGATAELVVATPTVYQEKAYNGGNDPVEWTQLDQLKTFNMGFRQGFDEALNTNIVSDTASGQTGGKQSCIYVKNVDGKDVRSGNTTLYDAFRNKVFIENYWNEQKWRTELNKLVTEVYSDVDNNSSLAIEAVLNAYFNLLDAGSDTFDGYQTLTREEFYAFLVRATQPVQEFEENAAYMQMIGDSDTSYSILAGQVEGYNFINVANGGLNKTNVHQKISRLEAVYMIVNMFFPEEYAQATDKSAGFSDTIAGGDIALSIGFKEEVKNEDKTTSIVEKELWEQYTLAYMLGHTDKAMQSELYRALATAKQVGLVNSNPSRWNEAVSKEEAINFIMYLALAKNNIEGYATTEEYAAMDVEEYNEVEDKTVEDDTILYDLASLPGELLMKFEEAYFSINVLDYETEDDVLEAQIAAVVEICNEAGMELPESYDLAFREWRKQYEGWEEPIEDPILDENGEIIVDEPIDGENTEENSDNTQDNTEVETAN